MIRPKRLSMPTLLGILLTILAPSAIAAGDERPVTSPSIADRARDPSTMTAKERMRSKGDDPQRVDDCKVPVEKRDRRRPTACAAD